MQILIAHVRLFEQPSSGNNRIIFTDWVSTVAVAPHRHDDLRRAIVWIEKKGYVHGDDPSTETAAVLGRNRWTVSRKAGEAG